MEVTELRQPSTTDRVANESILTPDKSIQSISAGREGHSDGHTDGLMSPPPKPYGHTRPLSFAARNGNRLSLSFPIQLPDRERGGRQTPNSSASFSSHNSPVKEFVPTPSPKDSAGFMVTLAAQERHVLELKEELKRAEDELKKLKRQWAVYEGSKKKAQLKQVEQLGPVPVTPLGTNTVENDVEISAATRRSSELDRRKALLASTMKDSRRKIMTGGHTRTLSLLSPDRSSYDVHPSPIFGLTSDDESRDAITVVPRPVMPDTSQGLSRINSNRARHSYHDSATNGVKQIAEDIKAGLWTFMEDLRQATVGEEAVQLPNTQSGSEQTAFSFPGKKNNGGSPAGSHRPYVTPLRSVSHEKSSCGGPQIESSKKPATVKTQSQTPKHSVATTIPAELDDDDWANWDSPISKGTSPRWSDSTTMSSQDAGTRTPNTIRFDSQH